MNNAHFSVIGKIAAGKGQGFLREKRTEVFTMTFVVSRYAHVILQGQVRGLTLLENGDEIQIKNLDANPFLSIVKPFAPINSVEKISLDNIGKVDFLWANSFFKNIGTDTASDQSVDEGESEDTDKDEEDESEEDEEDEGEEDDETEFM